MRLGAGADQREVRVLLVEAVKQHQLLVAVTRIVRGVELERDSAGRGIERTDEVVEKEIVKPPQRRDVDGVLESGKSGLAGQVIVVGRSAADPLEDRVASERIVIVAIFVAGQDAEDPLANHFVHVVTGQVWVSGIAQAGDESFGQADLVIELLDG